MMKMVYHRNDQVQIVSCRDVRSVLATLDGLPQMLCCSMAK